MSNQQPTMSELLPRARLAFQDAALAVQEVADSKTEQERRLRWTTALTLLRLISHVLINVESKNSPFHKKEIEDWWKELGLNREQYAIFWEFIQKTRNVMLKEYDFRVERRRGALMGPGGRPLAGPGGRPLAAENSWSIREEGPFKDKNGINVCREALSWWQSQLDYLESRIASNQAR